MNRFDYVTLETKSIFAREVIVGCWIPNNSEIGLTDKAGLDKTNILPLGS
jgi:hypothetical protein